MSGSTSWEESGRWYDALVGPEGHYYHRHVVIPKALALLALQSGDRLLDLACGQGVLARGVPKEVEYTGLDLAPTLVEAARAQSKGTFHVADITEQLPVDPDSFTHAACLLALQNLLHPERALKQAARALCSRGVLLLVLMHPFCRIPRQSHWQIDEGKRLQYRRVDLYMSELKIPIATHPGKGKHSPQTWTFHRPLSAWAAMLADSGFLIERLEEWVSEKKSTGAKAKMENRARAEFPLFMAIKAQKK